MKRKFLNPATPTTFFLSILVVLAGFGTGSVVTGQEIYKSVDESGNVIYSQEPPEDQEETTVLQPTPEPTAEEMESANQQLQQLKDDSRALEQEALQLESQQLSESDDVSLDPYNRDIGVGVGAVGAPVIRHEARETHREVRGTHQRRSQKRQPVKP